MWRRTGSALFGCCRCFCPTKALTSWRRAVERHLSGGAKRVRIAGNVPHPGYGRSYVGWDRYEAAVDRALGDLPVWAPCLYDTRIAPAEVIEAATRRHREILGHDGTHRSNELFQSAGGLADFLAPEPDPLTHRSPDLEIADPSPAAAREATRRIAAFAGADQLDDLVLAVSETVANAILHGVPPVTIRFWAGDHHVVIDVHDEGAGPIDPLAGLLAQGADNEGSGRGLWIAHQLGIEVTLFADAGFRVQFRVEASSQQVAASA